MGVNSRADGAGTAADAGPGGAPATRLRHAAVCGAAAALCVSILTDVHRFLAALRENLCPVFGCARSQEALEERRNRWRHRREMDRKTLGALRDGPHDLGVEIAREFFPVVAHELELDIAPGLDGMVGTYLAVFGRQLYQTAGAQSIPKMLAFEQGELQRDRLRQTHQRDSPFGQKKVILPTNATGIVDGDGL